MKILQIAYIFPPRLNISDGITNVVYKLSRELTKRGHDVVIYTSTALDLHTKKRLPNSIYLSSNGIRMYYLDYSIRYGTLIVTPSLLPLLNKTIRKFDIVHIHSFMSFQGLFASIFARESKVPYVMQAHGSLPRGDQPLMKYIYDNLFSRSMLRGASKVIALSQSEAQQYKTMGVLEEKIAIIPNGIDFSEYSNLPPKGSLKKKFNISEDKKIILFLGRIHEIKGIDFLVKAYAHLINDMKYNGATLVIVGPDDGYLRSLQALIKALKISERVLITGPLYGLDKLEAWVDADVYVLPSRYDTFPMTILEAYVCGKPVIASRVGALEDLVVDGITGLLVEPGDIKQLTNSLFFLLNDMNKAKEMGLRGNQFVKEYSTIGRVVDKLENVYKLAIGAKYYSIKIL